MKMILKGFIIGLLMLIANICIAIWSIDTISGTVKLVNNSSGWLAIGSFFLLITAICIAGFFIICQGIAILFFATENADMKKKLTESKESQSSDNETKENTGDYDYIKYP